MNTRKAALVWLACTIAAIGLAVLLRGDPFAAFVLGLIYLFIGWSSAMNLLNGYAGLVPMMAGGIAGISGYATVYLMMHLGWSFWIAMPLSSLVAAVTGVVLCLPALRLRGFYFILSSLVIQTAMTLLFIYFSAFTNGDTGITQIPKPGLWWPSAGLHEMSSLDLVVVLAVFASLSVGLVLTIVGSRLGTFLTAMREDDILAETLGIDVTKMKVLAFFIGSYVFGIGGAFWSVYIGFISPRSFDVLVSLNIWLIVAFGGRGTIAGPILGAFVLVPIPYLLQDAFQYKDIIYGLLIILVMVAAPAGLYGSYVNKRRAARSSRAALSVREAASR